MLGPYLPIGLSSSAITSADIAYWIRGKAILLFVTELRGEETPISNLLDAFVQCDGDCYLEPTTLIYYYEL